MASESARRNSCVTLSRGQKSDESDRLRCGAGGVEYRATARRENNDVTLIDQSADLVRKIGDELDVRAMVGHASHPDALERAGAYDADMIIAVTYSDEVNMVACQIAHSIFDIPKKVARIRAQQYTNPLWAHLFSRENLPSM